MNIGDRIKFGNYSWIVLDITNDKTFLISEYIIDQRSYNQIYQDTTWSECSLRAYLNNDFLNTFSLDEQARILVTENQNPNNQWYGTLGGEVTLDRIFLLSLEEIVSKYFGDSSDKLFHKGANQRYWFERKDSNNAKRIARLSDNPNQVWWYWTRSPGRVGVKAVYIHGDGNIGIQGNNIKIGNLADGICTGGVRPCMWIKNESK